MTTNLKDLRKEAYRLWGIGGHTVIYDFPKRHRPSQSKEFRFRLDYSEDKASWPRAYALANSPEEPPMMRVIVPIILVKSFHNFTIEQKVWYDMPMFIHERILELVGESEVKRQLPWYKSLANRFLPIQHAFTGTVDSMDYQFGIIQHNSEFVVRVS